MCKLVRLALNCKQLTHRAENAEALNSAPTGPGSDLCTLEV